jgi:hypothetical protein
MSTEPITPSASLISTLADHAEIPAVRMRMWKRNSAALTAPCRV